MRSVKGVLDSYTQIANDAYSRYFKNEECMDEQSIGVWGIRTI